MDTLKIFTDGGSRGNPGPSASAFVVYKNDELINQGSIYLGITTNNQAEYKAVLEALKWLAANTSLVGSIKEINFFLDSELVVRQLKGVYKIKNAQLLIVAGEVKKLLSALKVPVNFTSVLREKNKLADRLVNECLDNN